MLGCAHGAPGATDPPATLQRVYDLAGGFVHLEVRIPQSPPARKPLVIGPLGLEERLLERGIAVAHFDVDWSVLHGLRAAPDLDRPGASEGLGAPEAPDASGAGAPDAATGSDGPPEAPAGESVGAWMLAAPRPGLVGRSYFGLIEATADGILPDVLDQLVAIPEIDPTRIGIAGSSTHGFIALEALASEPRLAAGVVRVACGDYHAFLRSSSLGLRDDPRWLEEGELVLDADYEAALRAREPILHAERYPPRPLLMLNGANDPAIPRACAERTAAVFRDAYREAGVPQRFRFELFPDAAHDLGPAAEDLVIAWWTRWLLEEPPRDAR